MTLNHENLLQVSFIFNIKWNYEKFHKITFSTNQNSFLEKKIPRISRQEWDHWAMDIVITQFDSQLRYVKEFSYFFPLEIGHLIRKGVVTPKSAASEIISHQKISTFVIYLTWKLWKFEVQTKLRSAKIETNNFVKRFRGSETYKEL